MENYRQKAVALVVEQTIKDLEHAFDYWDDFTMTDAFSNPLCFFEDFLEEATNIPEEIVQSYYKLNSQGIELRRCRSFDWSECEPIDMEDY